jgi:hypothetical protein
LTLGKGRQTGRVYCEASPVRREYSLVCPHCHNSFTQELLSPPTDLPFVVDDPPECPECHRPMDLVRDVPLEAPDAGGMINVTLESNIFNCDQHGEFRVYISGVIDRPDGD